MHGFFNCYEDMFFRKKKQIAPVTWSHALKEYNSECFGKKVVVPVNLLLMGITPLLADSSEKKNKKKLSKQKLPVKT